MKLSAIATALIISTVAATSASTAHQQHQQQQPKVSVSRSAMNLLGLQVHYVWNMITSLFVSPARVSLKFELKPPQARTDGIVNVPPSTYMMNSKEDFVKALHGVKNEQEALNVVFHPNALHYLTSLDSGETVAEVHEDEIKKDIIYALMLRSRTLQGIYSPAYVSKAYTDCMTHLWGILTESLEQKPKEWAWPCSATDKCAANEAGKTFEAAALGYPVCAQVMSPEIGALARILEAAITADKTLQNSARDVRDALKKVILDAKFTNHVLVTGFESLQEIAAGRAAQHIDEKLKILEGMDGTQKPYKLAKERFNQRMEELDKERDNSEKELQKSIVKNAVEGVAAGHHASNEETGPSTKPATPVSAIKPTETEKHESNSANIESHHDPRPKETSADGGKKPNPSAEKTVRPAEGNTHSDESGK